MAFAAETDIWRFQPHAEVWLILLVAIAMAWYAARIIAPKAAPTGEAPFARYHRLAFLGAMVLLWVASDWPMHDISEEYLYSVHMIQHLLITFVVPPLLWASMPEWLARLIVVDGSLSARIIRRLVHPLVAGVVFNALQGLMHWNTLVELSVRSGPFHYAMHLLMFASALAMWTPVVGPLREFHLSEPAKMVYLFAMSIVPTVPAAWLTFAEGSVYPIYDHAQRLFGISVAADQQAAGAVMKVLGGLYLWTLIAIRFFRFSAAQRHADAEDRRLRFSANTLTTEDVEAEFERLGPPLHEPRLPGDAP